MTDIPQNKPTSVLPHPLAFIVGHPRSGTTLLASIFDRHPEVAVPPETHFFKVRDVRWAARTDLTNPQAIAKAISDSRIHELEIPKQVLVDHLSEHDINTPDARLLPILLDLYASRHRKPLTIEKTPHHFEHIDTILTEYPKAKVIGIIRDGRDVCLSLIEKPWAHNSIEKHAIDWTRTVDILQSAAKRHPDRVVLVRFEDLVHQPRETTQSLCQFVQLTYHPQQLEPSVQTGVLTERERDWKHLVEKPISPEQAEKWRDHPDAKQIDTLTLIMKNHLTQQSYDTRAMQAVTLRQILRARALRFAFSPTTAPLRNALRPLIRRIPFIQRRTPSEQQRSLS